MFGGLNDGNLHPILGGQVVEGIWTAYQLISGDRNCIVHSIALEGHVF